MALVFLMCVPPNEYFIYKLFGEESHASYQFTSLNNFHANISLDLLHLFVYIFTHAIQCSDAIPTFILVWVRIA